MSPTLRIKNLHAAIGNTKILNGVSLDISQGEIHIIMGQNGSGKSTLLSVLMGNPKYMVTMGSVTLDKKNILKLTPTQRAQAGLFLGFQHPQVVTGVALGNFLRMAKNSINESRYNQNQTRKPTTPPPPATQDRLRALRAGIAPAPFAALMRSQMEKLKINPAFMSRSVNEGFSGGEKKKSEVLQMAMLEPSFAFLDEIDSGLDIDALKVVAKELRAIQRRVSNVDTRHDFVKSKQGMGLIIVSHNPRILDFIKPDKIHVMSKGKIIAQGGAEIVKKIEGGGYDSF